MTFRPLSPLPCRYSAERMIARPEFWIGLCAARDPDDPQDQRLIAAYHRAADALKAGREPSSVPEITEWKQRYTMIVTKGRA